MVRFLDNFSAGTRGATTAEWILKQYPDYTVLFLYRLNSMTPFNRKYTHGKTLPLDMLYDASTHTLHATRLKAFEEEARRLEEVFRPEQKTWLLD